MRLISTFLMVYASLLVAIQGQTADEYDNTDVATVVSQCMTDPDSVYEEVDQKPVFPGGEYAFLKWVAESINYSNCGGCNSVQGKVTVRFVVTKDGSIGDVEVIRSLNPYYDNEVIRVVKSAPKFTPGMIGGETVNCWYVLPVFFRCKGR